jgi:hypothetical protein
MECGAWSGASGLVTDVIHLWNWCVNGILWVVQEISARLVVKKRRGIRYACDGFMGGGGFGFCGDGGG